MRKGAIELTAGQVWDDRYEIIAPVGAGTAMFVFKAMDRQSGDTVALKIAESMQGRTSPYVLRQMIVDYEVRSALLDSRIPRAHRLVLGATPYSVCDLFAITDLHELIKVGERPNTQQAKDFILAWTGIYADLEASGVWNLDLVPRNICFAEGAPWSSARMLDFGHAQVEQSLFDDIAPQLGSMVDKLLMEQQQSFQRFVEMLYVGCLFFEPWGKTARMFSQPVRDRLPTPPARACRPELGIAAEWLDEGVAQRTRWTFADFARHIGLPSARSLRTQGTSVATTAVHAAIDDFAARPRLRSLRFGSREATVSCLRYLSQPQWAQRFSLWRLTAGICLDDARADVPNAIDRYVANSHLYGTREEQWQQIQQATAQMPLVLVIADIDKADARTREFLATIRPDARLLLIASSAERLPLFGEQSDME